MRTIGLLGDDTWTEIPTSHRDLVECPAIATLAPVSADGYPQTSVLWGDFDGQCIRINTMRGFAKDRNMRRDPQVTLLCFGPHEPLHYLEVRGRVIESTKSGAREHLDRLTPKYAGRPIRFFGDSVPVRFADTEIPVVYRIRPVHVVALDATGEEISL